MTPQWAAALRLARLGLPVFPLGPNSKAPPAGRYGAYKTATVDEVQIRAWAEEFPDHNYGVHPGPGGALVLDLDVKGDGEAALADLEIEHGLVPYFLKVRTPSGGWHLYAWLPEGAPLPSSSIRRLGPGVDVKCATGHVVGPGCAIDGRPYRVVEEAENGVAPDWLLKRCGAAPERHPDADRWVCEPDTASQIEAATRYARETAPVAVEGRGGNNTTYQVACRVRDMGISEEQCAELMIGHYNKLRCRPRWGLDDLMGIVEHAYKYAQNPAGTMADTSVFDGVDRPNTGNQAPGATKRRTIRFYGWDDWNFPRPMWLVEGYLPSGAVVVQWGTKNTYKTFVTLDMLLHAAAGHETWCGHKIHKPRLRVGIAAGEGQGDLPIRVHAWAKIHNKGQKLENIFVMPVMPRFDDAEDLADLKAAIDEEMGGDIDVLVLDTLARATRGLKENETDDMKEFMDRLGALAGEYDCTVVVIHHGGKSKTVVGPRGAQAIADNADVVVAVRGDEASITSTLQVTEQRYYEKPAPVTLRGTLTDVVMPDGEERKTLVFKHHDPAVVTDAKTGEVVAPESVDNLRAKIARELLLNTAPEDLPWSNKDLAEHMSVAGANGTPRSLSEWVEDRAARFLPEFRRKPGRFVEWWVPDDLRKALSEVRAHIDSENHEAPRANSEIEL